MTHSPAPWRWKTVEGYGSSWLYDDDGNQIWHSITTPSKPDAALIAAAPELLEACKNALSYMEVYNQVSPTISEYEMNIANSIRSAIAKAEGNVSTQTETIWQPIGRPL